MKRGIVLVLGLILTLGFIGCDPNVEEPPKVIHPDYQGLFKLNNVEVYYRFTETHRILIENEQEIYNVRSYTTENRLYNMDGNQQRGSFSLDNNIFYLIPSGAYYRVTE